VRKCTTHQTARAFAPGAASSYAEIYLVLIEGEKRPPRTRRLLKAGALGMTALGVLGWTHAESVAAETIAASMIPQNPVAGLYLMIRRFDGEVGGVGAVPAAWLTPTITPPTLNTAERPNVEVLAGIVYVAVPEPVPEPVMVAHVWFDDEVHEQFDAVVTVMVPDAPLGGAVISDGVTENVQVALGSLIVNERPAIVSVAVRERVPVFAAAL